MKFSHIILGLVLGLMVISCKSHTLVTSTVAYQSVRTVQTLGETIPDEAKIAVTYTISDEGELTAIVFNQTSEIMIIDQTMSFFVNSDGISTSYYDPTVRTTTETSLSSSSKGATVNLGAVGGALGIGGSLGSLLSGINVGGTGTAGQAVSNTTYFADQPRISLAPKSRGAMSKVFAVKGLGKNSLKNSVLVAPNLSTNDSFCKFSVCVSYSLDGGKTFEKLVTDFYVNSLLVAPIAKHGQVNDALRQIYEIKPDALYESWWLLYFNNNIVESTHSVYDSRVQGILYDYQ